MTGTKALQVQTDIPLQWMVEELGKLPFPVHLDMTHLHLFPRADGMQHCEVRSVQDASWLRRLRDNGGSIPRARDLWERTVKSLSKRQPVTLDTV